MVVAADAGAVSVTTFVLESGVGTFGAVAGGDLRTGGGDEAAVTLAAAGDGGVCIGRLDAVFDIDGDRRLAVRIRRRFDLFPRRWQ